MHDSDDTRIDGMNTTWTRHPKHNKLTIGAQVQFTCFHYQLYVMKHKHPTYNTSDGHMEVWREPMPYTTAST
jgi:hypothetical protein